MRHSALPHSPSSPITAARRVRHDPRRLARCDRSRHRNPQPTSARRLPFGGTRRATSRRHRRRHRAHPGRPVPDRPCTRGRTVARRVWDFVTTIGTISTNASLRTRSHALSGVTALDEPDLVEAVASFLDDHPIPRPGSRSTNTSNVNASTPHSGPERPSGSRPRSSTELITETRAPNRPAQRKIGRPRCQQLPTGVTHAGSLRLEVLLVLRVRCDLNRHPIDDLKPVAIEAGELRRVVGHDAEAAHRDRRACSLPRRTRESTGRPA